MTTASPFVWGQGGAQLTPEQLAKRRMIEDAALARGVDTSPVGHWSQGLARVADALGGSVRRGRLDKAEGESQKQGSEAFSRVMAAMNGGQPADVPVSAGSATAPQPTYSMTPRPGDSPMPGDASDPRVASAFAQTMPKRGGADVLRDGLVQRGLPEHVADGFMMNFQDESALNPAVNEASPVVPGSRGGYGLAQWTGPRRQALEAFAQQQGKDVSDPNVQLDFLTSELQGPEAEAAKAIMATQNPNDAAAAIATHFLRPAPEHLQERVGRYTQRAPGNQVAQAGGMPGGISPEVLAAASSPHLTDTQRTIVNTMLKGAMERSQPKDLMEVGGRIFDPNSREFITEGKPETITVNDRLVDKGTGEVIADYSGDAEKAARRSEMGQATSDVVITAARRAMDAAKNPLATGTVGGLMSNIGESDAAEVWRQVDTLKSVAASENIQAMRAASPTGGALGNASDADIALLKNKAGALDPRSPNFQRDLEDYSRSLFRVIHGTTAGDKMFEQQWSKQPEASGAPKAGAVEDGYRFKGGDPSDPNSWERAQ